jgi:putative component of toxin-antitoxin plasmid stabilization module
VPLYTIKEFEQINGRQTFYKLLKDKDCPFENFAAQIEKDGRYTSELRTAFAYMEMVANLKMLPVSKMREITPSKDKVKEYEIKTKHLRIYFIHLEKTGKIVVLGGFKTTQKQDIGQFRSLKKQFLENYKQ